MLETASAPQNQLDITTKFKEKKNLTKFLNSPFSVAGLVFVFYVALLLVTLLFFGNHDLRDFATPGGIFINENHVSTIIKADPTYKYYPIGYDGQFSYYLALDPPNARYYVDLDSYRYTRILYPMLARALALANPNLVPLTLVLINLLAVTVGTWAIAAWCRQRGLVVWLALVYAFYVGQLTAFTLDVSDILAYTFVALAVYLLERWPQRLPQAAFLFALAGLTRETTLLFPALYMLWQLLAVRKAAQPLPIIFKALVFGFIAAAPAFGWQIFLKVWLGNFGWIESPGLAKLPFMGLYDLRPFSPAVLEVAQNVVMPGVFCGGVVLWTFWRNRQTRGRLELWILLSHTFFFAVLLPAASLTSIFAAGRIGMGIVMGSLYSLPYTKNKTWFYICAGLWLSASLLIILNPNSRLFRDPYIAPNTNPSGVFGFNPDY
jgi:hypothetical protein